MKESKRQTRYDMRICEHCGREYDESEADRDDLFCCIACEWGF